MEMHFQITKSKCIFFPGQLFLSIFTHTNFRIFCLPYFREISVREQISKLIQIISQIFCEIQFKKSIIKGQSKQKAGNFLFLRMLPLPFNAILGGSPRISFAFSFTHSLTNKQLSFSKRASFPLLFWFLYLRVVSDFLTIFFKMNFFYVLM